jgi:hypothetical protein
MDGATHHFSDGLGQQSSERLEAILESVVCNKRV